MPVCKSLPRGYNNPGERFCWLTSVKGHCSPAIKPGRAQGGARHQQPSQRMLCGHGHMGRQPGRELFARHIMERAGQRGSAQPLLPRHGDRLGRVAGRELEATSSDGIARRASVPPALTLRCSQGSASPRWGRHGADREESTLLPSLVETKAGKEQVA